jgi:hypothetical protein
MYPTTEDVARLAAGRETIPVAEALAAAIAEFEARTGWRPFWAPLDEVRTLAIPRADGYVLQLPEPCQTVVRVLSGTDELEFEPLSDGLRVMGVSLSQWVKGDLTAEVKGGAHAACPADARMAILIRATEIAGLDLGTVDAAKLSVGGISVERDAQTLFDRACLRHRRMEL